MACVPGRLSRVQISLDNGATYQNLGGIVDASLAGSVDELECTDHDSITREYIPNFFEATMDISLRWDEDEPGQVALESTVFPSTSPFKLYFLLENASGRRRYEADAFVTSWNPSGPLDDTAGLDVSLRLSNVLTGTVP